MIDHGIFKNEWVLLCERFRMTGQKEPSKLMRRRYYEYLSDRLTTEQFEEAAARIYAEHEFFPKPADFVELVSGSAEAGLEINALEQWDRVQGLLGNFSSPLTTLDEPARRAVKVMGGLREIGRREADVHFRRREFLELYEGYAKEFHREELPALTGRGRKLIQSVVGGQLMEVSDE